MKFADIADELGFSSENYFSRFFKKNTGQTPSDARQKLKCRLQNGESNHFSG
ncbi:helix-turn-helix domain-containing protein [Victivallis vadensis]|uniref:helix-turn-helix domain-containing protein n=1 Tax=Victivallis vadensis TaxID=172901 RepID=UPI003CFCFF31